MPATAYVFHRARGRLRLRIPQRRGDAAFFAGLEERLRSAPGIIGVSVNPVTASVLFLLDPTTDRDPLPVIESTGLLEVREGSPPMTPTLAALRRAVWRMDQSLHAQSAGSLELRTLAFLILVASAARQVVRGEMLAPAASLLWYAFELVRAPPSGAHARSGSDDENRR